MTQFNSRIGHQINTLQQLEAVIGKVSKVTITPTRITIKSMHKDGKALIAQTEALNDALEQMGHLPFNVELVSHG